MQFNIIAIDTGGTFSDIAALDEKGQLTILKVPSTPVAPEKAIINAMDILNATSDEVIHGTTVAINAVLQRKGARVALITTKGFKDIIEIGRQNRKDIYELVASRTEPLVPSEYRFEVEERVLADGSILLPVNKNNISRINQNIIDNEIDSIAISFLFSFLNDNHEVLIRDHLNDLGLPISISSEVFPEYREYERMSTTVIDAYIKPLVYDYINRLDVVLLQEDLTQTLALMKSSKGLGVPKGVLRKPVELLVSGLAGGVQAGELTSRMTGIQNIITLDIGGTSTDVAQITGGKVLEKYSYDIDNLPISSPAVDVTTIGAGGGSIAKLKGGLLRVGPESAGADPGPVAYNCGGNEVTVTDADLVYGLLPTKLAGGIIAMNKSLSIKALDTLSKKIGTNRERTISGIRQIFHENISAALRKVSTERGVDPRNYTLLAFGGAGPVHGAELAEIIDIQHVLIPPYPGIWSACGLLGADYRYDYSKGIMVSLDQIEESSISSGFEELFKLGMTEIQEDGIASIAQPQVLNNVAMRFVGQSYELMIPWDQDLFRLAKDFVKKHRREYGFASDSEPMEIVSLRTTIILSHPDPVFRELDESPTPTPRGKRNVQEVGDVPLYRREDFGKGAKITGPAIVDQDDSTTWVPESWTAECDNLGFMHLRRNEK
ncbi:MAG: hydantoinase/oxoprolinase family protein [Candidatus Heimdallarchaeota archaeon]|nr:hydantoinase/oxoprolinase family protein [Candidatus Heimdallarchaeota archaeon]